MDVDAIRAQIPATGKCRYFNTGGISPSLNVVTDSLMQELQMMAQLGPTKILDGALYEARMQKARQELADFIGVDVADLCLTRGVADGVTSVFNGIDWQPGDEVILTDEEHPAVKIPAERLPESHGVVLRHLPIDGSAQEVLARLAELMTDRTRMLAMSHVTTDTGTRLPAKQIVHMAHEHDVPVLYDAAQSLGQFPVNVTELGADFYSCVGYKWLYGPYATGFLYVKPQWQERLQIVPSGANYGSREGARRFEFSLMPATHYVATAAAVGFLQSVGMDRIELWTQGLARRLREGLRTVPGLQIESPEDPQMSTGIVAFSVADVDGAHISTQLRTHDIVTRPTAMKFSGVRFSVAMFTTVEEIDAAISAVAQIVDEAN